MHYPKASLVIPSEIVTSHYGSISSEILLSVGTLLLCHLFNQILLKKKLLAEYILCASQSLFLALEINSKHPHKRKLVQMKYSHWLII